MYSAVSCPSNNMLPTHSPLDEPHTAECARQQVKGKQKFCGKGWGKGEGESKRDDELIKTSCRA